MGSSKGYGFEVSDVLSVALIGGIVYLGYKIITSDAFKGVSDTVGGVGTASQGLGQGISDAGKGAGSFVFNITNETGETWKAFNDLIQDALNYRGQNKNVDYQLAGSVGKDEKGNINVVQNISSTGKAYGMETITVQTNKGSSTIISAPNTYNKDLGIGFDSKGQGYSSAFAGNKPTTYENKSTGTKLTRGVGSLLTGQGFN